jgi:predicted TPR repeat methyltransferase
MPIDETHVDRLCSTACELIDTRQFAEAEALLRDAAKLAPESARVHYCLGILWSDLRKPQAALAALDRAVAIDDSDAKAHNNRGSALQVLGRLDEAERAFRKALTLAPDASPPYVNLGKVLEQQGRPIEAIAVYSLGIERGVDTAVLGQYRAAAQGQSTPRSPDDWVATTFDNFAPTFDAHLRELRYEIPAVLSSLLRSHLPRHAEVLDLGCGTGQVALAVGGRAHRIVGVDLSEKMLALANAREVYTALHHREISTYLATVADKSVDAVCAADVFIYIGALEGVFGEVARVLRSGGFFAFSTETCDGVDYVLQPTGRYAQSDDYIRRLGATFDIVEVRTVTIRFESARAIPGNVYLLRRGAQAP